MTKLLVSEQIFSSFPGTVIGVVSFQGINNRGEDAEVMMSLWKEEARIVERFSGTVVNDHPHIATWREAYRKFGAKPKEYPSSIENLVRRSMKGHAMRHINRIVDIYNTISLRYIVPVGGEDLDKIQGDVQLTFATNNEAPVKLLGESEARPPKEGEVIYKDDVSAICRRWNWKEADRTKFTDDTTKGFLIVEGLPPVPVSIIEKAIDDLAGYIQTYCNGSVEKTILTEKDPEIVLS